MEKQSINSKQTIATWLIIGLIIGSAVGYAISKITATDKAKSHPPSAHQNIEPSTHLQEEYTCSMHPQIRQEESGICPICEMDLIPATSSASSDPLVLEMTKEAVKLANIQTSIVGEGKLANEATIRLSGKVQADERLLSNQVTHLSGRIEQLNVSFTGERIRKGQVIATIYAPELITAQRELLEALKLQEINPNLVEAARQKLRYWKISDEVIQQIEASSTIRETFPVYAQQSGVVIQRRVAIGDYVQRGAVLLEVMNLNRLWVIFEAYEEELAAIEIGSTIEFTTPALPERTFQSRVTFIDPIIDRDTRTAAIRTEINNRSEVLKPEMLIYGKVTTTRSSATQLLVPKTAVLWTGKRSVVYVKVPNTNIPSFQYREVELGETVGNQYEILEGLEVGEEVVTYGSFTIDAAAQLNNQASMMNQKVNIKGDEAPITPDFKAATPQAVQEELEQLVAIYIDLKNAFVATDSSLAKGEAMKLQNQLSAINATLLKGEALTYWETQRRALQTHTEKMRRATDIEIQRQQFEFVSDVLINIANAFEVSDSPLFVQFCPMAFDDRGADWLATEEAIRNPYFGDRMLKCGAVKAVLD